MHRSYAQKITEAACVLAFGLIAAVAVITAIEWASLALAGR